MFEKIFGQKLKKENKSEQPNMSRRKFLKFTGSALATLMVAGIPKFAVAEEKKEYNGKVMQLFSTEYFEFKERNGGKNEMNLEDFEKARLDFINHFSERAEYLVNVLGDNDMYFDVLYKRFAEYDAQGLLYQAMRKRNSYKDRDPVVKDYQSEHFYTRAKDFLPTSEEISPHEIDPRVGAGNRAFDEGDSSTYKSIVDNMEEYPSWSSDEQVERFKQLLDDSMLRQRVQKTDFNLAEVYSLIKAVLTYKEKNKTPLMPMSDELLIERFISERESFGRRELLGPKTDTYIHFNYKDPNNAKRFDGDTNDEMAKKLKVKNVQRFDGDETGAVVADILSAIVGSEGETFIHFNTHGNVDRVAINEHASLQMRSIAMALVERLRRSKDRNELGKITLFFDACHSYDIAETLVFFIKHIYEFPQEEVPTNIKRKKLPTPLEELGIDFADLQMPTIVSSAQKGSLGFSYETNFDGTVKKNMKGLEEEGVLNGNFMLKRIQPRGAYTMDMTVFAGKRGKSVEIAAREQGKA